MGKLKCNVDVAFFNERKAGSIAPMLRDSRGCLIAGKSHKIQLIPR